MKPIVLAMVICDQYYRDAQTGKSILTGTFSSINCVRFPSKHGNCAVYIALSDVATGGTAQMVFKKEDGEFEMKLPPWEVKAPDDRRGVVEIGGNINGLPIPEAGYYEFAFFWNDMPIASRRLKVNQVEMPQQTNNPDNEPNSD